MYLYPLIYPHLAWFPMLTVSRLYARVCTRAWMLLTLTGTLPYWHVREGPESPARGWTSEMPQTRGVVWGRSRSPVRPI